MNSVLGGYFLEFCFLESILGVSLSVAKYFWGRSEIPKSPDACL